MAQGDVRHKSILFGCDNWARVIDETTPYISKSSKGIEMISYLIKPNEDLKDAYPKELKDSLLDVDTRYGKARWVEYPTMWVVDKNPSRKNAIVRVLCTFDGKKTAHTKREEHLSEDVKHYQMANERLNMASIADAEEIESLIKEKIKLVEKLSELFEKMPGGRKTIKIEDEDKTK